MDAKELLEQVKATTEIALEEAIETGFEDFKAAVVTKLKDLIPGEKYDAAAEAAILAILPVIKVKLLEQVEKISDKV